MVQLGDFAPNCLHGPLPRPCSAITTHWGTNRWPLASPAGRLPRHWTIGWSGWHAKPHDWAATISALLDHAPSRSLTAVGPPPGKGNNTLPGQWALVGCKANQASEVHCGLRGQKAEQASSVANVWCICSLCQLCHSSKIGLIVSRI
jgi:hypothetical protein